MIYIIEAQTRASNQQNGPFKDLLADEVHDQCSDCGQKACLFIVDCMKICDVSCQICNIATNDQVQVLHPVFIYLSMCKDINTSLGKAHT